MQRPRTLETRPVWDAVDREADRFTAVLRDLIRLSAEGEAAVQHDVMRRCTDLGGQPEEIIYEPRALAPLYESVHPDVIQPGERTAVVAAWPGEGNGRRLLLFAHPDTEPLDLRSPWRWPRFDGLIEEGRLHGWGAADDLAGLAAMLCAVDAVRSFSASLQGTLMLASVSSKGHARGILPILDRLPPPDGALYLHPAESGRGLAEIKSATPGTARFVVRLAGRPPATMEPDQTPFAREAINPVDKLVILIRTFQSWAEQSSEAGEGVSAHVTYVSTGDPTALQHVPVAGEFGGSLSYPPPMTPARARIAVADAIFRAADRDPWLKMHPPEIVWVSETVGAEIPPDHLFTQLASRCIAAVTGRAPALYRLHAASDIRHPIVYRSIPTLALGPLAGNLVQAGGVDEWVDLEEYLQTVKITAAIILGWCGPDAAAGR